MLPLPWKSRLITDQLIGEIDQYHRPEIDLPPIVYTPDPDTPEPMPDKPPVPLPLAEMLKYPQGYGQPRLFAGAGDNEGGPSN